MGCSPSSNRGRTLMHTDGTNASLVNKHINQQLAEDRRKAKKQIKILLLGAGESGKSTILNQMRIIHGSGFSPSDLERRRVIVFTNLIQGMATILKAMETLNIHLEDQMLRYYVSEIYQCAETVKTETPPLSMFEKVAQLWKDKGVKRAFEQRHLYQLDDSVRYFLSNTERIGEPNYQPTVEDVLHTRVATTGVVEVSFMSRNHMCFRVFDVGGQRTERRKWVHCFDNVDAVIFVTAISEYDLMLREDDSTKRMEESINLFTVTANSEWFSKAALLLFLNKRDLFAEKIKIKPLTIMFPEYKGPQEYGPCLDYIQGKFESNLKNPTKQKMYVHQTCATDTTQVRFVIDSVMDMCVQRSLLSVGVE